MAAFIAVPLHQAVQTPLLSGRVMLDRKQHHVQCLKSNGANMSSSDPSVSIEI
jgi:hypothetical protein